MNIRMGMLFACLITALMPATASAWFIWIPTGAIARALETDPDSINVSESDRSLGKCAGLHVNQAERYSASSNPFPDSPGASQTESKETTFHATMADMAGDKASDKNKVRDLARAYSTRWRRVAGADANANRTYGADLARACVSNDIPITLANLPAWQARQDEKKRVQAEEERKRAEEAQARLRAEEEAKRVRAEEDEAKRLRAPQRDVVVTPPAMQSNSKFDYTAEAKKSARILGCTTEDVRVVGVDGQNILFSANCGSESTLLLTCDNAGLCLRK